MEEREAGRRGKKEKQGRRGRKKVERKRKVRVGIERKAGGECESEDETAVVQRFLGRLAAVCKILPKYT
jgi:hypothetical protein